MLPLLLLAAPVALSRFANAVAFPGPAPTPVYLGRNKIREAAPEPTAAPAIVERATNWTATCGFGDDWDPTCNSGYACVFYVPGGTTVGMVGCVQGTDFTDGGFATSCIDYKAISKSSLCDAACWQNQFIQRCTDAKSPYCQSSTYPGANIADFDCDTDGASTWHTYLSTSTTQYSGSPVTTLTVNNERISGTVLTGWQDLSSSVAGASSSTATTHSGAGKAGASQSSKTTSTASSASAAPAQSSSGGSSSNAGAIAGGVVGGVVGLAIVGAVVFFILRHQKKKSQAAQSYAQVPGSAEGGAAGYRGDAKNAHELSNANERMEADGGNVIYKKEAPPTISTGAAELNSIMSPQEAPSPEVIHEIGTSQTVPKG